MGEKTEKTTEQIIAEAFVQSWDQHIGQDGAIAVLNALNAAGLTIISTIPPIDEGSGCVLCDCEVQKIDGKHRGPLGNMVNCTNRARANGDKSP